MCRTDDQRNGAAALPPQQEIPMSKLNFLAALTVASVALAAAAPAYAHGGFGHGSDHQGSDRNQNQNQSRNLNQNQGQSGLTKLTTIIKTENNHSILQGLKQWEMKQERTRALSELVKLVQELNLQAKLGQLSQQQFQQLLNQGLKLEAKFLANGGTQAELAAAGTLVVQY
jgi:hypothetical protein